MTTNTFEITARETERQRIAKQLEEWRAAGGIPELVTSCRASHMSPSQDEANKAAWENAK